MPRERPEPNRCRDCRKILMDPGSKRCRACYKKAGSPRIEVRPDPLTDYEKWRTSLVCSFCSKTQREVKKLIAGPTVYICDECVWLCTEVIYASDLRETGGLDFAIPGLADSAREARER